MTSDDGWGEKCPDCGVTFPVLHGPHPTWVRCQLPGVREGPRRLTPCGDFVADGHDVYDAECPACAEANSDAPEWTL